jgi:hypothetical protein
MKINVHDVLHVLQSLGVILLSFLYARSNAPTGMRPPARRVLKGNSAMVLNRSVVRGTIPSNAWAEYQDSPEKNKNVFFLESEIQFPDASSSQ